MTRRPGRLARIAFPALTLAWCAATWALSDQSDPKDYVGIDFDLPDKPEHAVWYAVGGVLSSAAVSGFAARRALIAAIVFAGAWGTLDEIHQSWVPGRDASGMDLAADVIGASIGALAFVGLRSRRQTDSRADDELLETKEPTRP